MTKKHDQEEVNQQIGELTADLQRLRADFENYRKRVEQEKQQARQMGATATVKAMLPVIDTIERAVAHVPEDLAENNWVKGVVGLNKNLDKSLQELGLERIVATPGTPFDPNLHEAVMMLEDAEGDQEVVHEKLMSGYKLNGAVIRPSMVKVTRK